MTRVRFWKLESIGNDFPLIHEDDFQGDLSALAVAICDRRFGVGGDGLLTVSDGPRIKLRMFNPDGTEDFCGNGIRCAALHVRSQGWVGSSFEMTHVNRVVPVQIDKEKIRTTIGVASYKPADVPLNSDERFDQPIFWENGREIFGSALTTGSTHVVIPVEELPKDEEFFDLGPKIEHFELYPARTSIIWTQVAAPGRLSIRIWERGVGETLGCGTGSSAAAADYLRRGYQGTTVQVDNCGGTVFIEMDRWDAPITVTGDAKAVFEGSFMFKG
ncbi:MAG TPA: diaminopimelate epimerase [Fimbriimonas sp.]|nr:diaminopimelate epimerase [Fimbriimonas sp.]